MKTPPLYKAFRADGKGEVIGYFYNKHFGMCIESEDAYHRIKPETLQIQCSDGEFRPIGEVEITSDKESELRYLKTYDFGYTQGYEDAIKGKEKRKDLNEY